MFLIELTYKADLAEIDAHMAAHVVFLKKHYAAGNFLVSGRKIPRDGGIILAVGKSRQQIQTIIEEDPFYQHGLADFRIIEFRASQRAHDMPETDRAGLTPEAATGGGLTSHPHRPQDCRGAWERLRVRAKD